MNGKVCLIIHELKTHTLVEVVEELLRGGEGVWWVGFPTISKYVIKHMSFKNIKYMSKTFTCEKEESLKVRSTEKYLCQSCLIN